MDSSFIVKDFDGIDDEGTRIPPDPYCAVGPTSVMTVVNSTFRIYDKSGKILKTITADEWFANILPNGFIFDPKIIYDHFSKRWVMVWLDEDDSTKRSNLLVSVSDDEDPLGDWYNYALPGNLNGNTVVNNWSDYQGVGYDDQAIYVTSNQWAFGSGSFQYAKIRIINKAELYANTGGEVTWLDVWNVKDQYPNPTGSIFGVRPVRMYGHPGEYYFVTTSPYTAGTYLTIHKLKNPFTAFELNAYKVNVSTYYSPNDADQLGGSTIPIETSGASIRSEPIYRDGKIYLVHSVADKSFQKYSCLHYISIDVSTNSAVEDVTIGQQGYWYFYPSIAVDKYNNIALTYSRSGLTEYIGAYFLTKSAYSDNFNGSRILQTGKAYYVKDFEAGRNRWGDYNGIWLDPVNESHVWMFTEFAAKTNIWGTWVGEVRLRPYDQAYCFVKDTSINFRNQFLNTLSDTTEFVIKNYGKEDLEISDISNVKDCFKFLALPKFPVNLKAFDSLIVKVGFIPTELSQVNDKIKISTNSFVNPERYINLIGKGFYTEQAQRGILYGAAGKNSNGDLIEY